MSGCGCEIEVRDAAQRRVLRVLLAINAALFFIEFGVGWLADSTALIADSLDMLADAIVYGLGLYAVGRTQVEKARAARVSGWFQLVLGIAIVMDIVRRAVFGSEPVSSLMMAMGTVALAANVACLALIHGHRDGGVHMRASWIFSANDVVANLGVILGGSLVWALDNRWPDLLVGAAVAGFVLRGAWRILREARAEERGACGGRASPDCGCE